MTPDEKLVERCGTCRFAGPITTTTLDGTRSVVESYMRTCRLNPPVAITEYTFEQPSTEFEFPTVHEDEWCGQYSAVTCNG